MVFLTAWTPYCVESLWAMHQTQISVIAAVMPTMCCKASPMLNPLVLIMSSSDFREDFKKLCPCLFERRRLSHVLTIQRHRDRKTSQSSTYYIRECDGVGRKEDAAAVYYNKERVFIGHVRTQSIDTESTILKKDYNQRQNLQISIDPDEETHSHKTKRNMKRHEQGGKQKGKPRKVKSVRPQRVEPEAESRPSTA